MKKILAIVGPTACFKSDLALEVANQIPSEIISADSMQVYKGMDIGTAKVAYEKREQVKHHLIDIMSIDEPFSAEIYQRIARQVIDKVRKLDKTAIIVGGTGLYLRAAIYELRFPKGDENESKEVRRQLENELKDKGIDNLARRLKELDKEAYENIDISNGRRLVRALEIIKITGNKFSLQRKDWDNWDPKYPAVVIGLNMERESLYERINERVERMIEDGLLDEVQQLVDKGLKDALVAQQSLGYKELIAYIDNETSLEDAIDTIKKRTRNFAKRQLTWFKKDPNVRWYDISRTSIKTVAREAVGLLK